MPLCQADADCGTGALCVCVCMCVRECAANCKYDDKSDPTQPPSFPLVPHLLACLSGQQEEFAPLKEMLRNAVTPKLALARDPHLQVPPGYISVA